MEKLTIIPPKTKYPYRLPIPNEHKFGCNVSGCLVCEDAHPLADPHCLLCHGGGFLLTNKFGNKVEPCVGKGCHAEHLRNIHNLTVFDKKTGLNRKKTFALFLNEIVGVDSAFQCAKQLASGKCGFVFLTLRGKVGTGKTHLAYAIGNELVNRGVPVQMYPVSDFLSKLRQSIESGGMEQLVQYAKEVGLLVLDDYRCNFHSDWATSRLEEIINIRYEHTLFTVITTNNSISDFPEQIASRLCDTAISKVVDIEADDYRSKR